MLQRQKKNTPRCVLQTMDNTLLGSGRVARMEYENIESPFIEVSSEHALPLLRKDTKIKIVIYESGGRVTVWTGLVYYSAEDRLRVESVVMCSNSEKRKLHRVTIYSPASLLVYNKVKGEAGDDTGETTFGTKLLEVPVIIRDISSGGCLIEMTKRVNIAGRALKVRLAMYSEVGDLQVEIRNVREKNSTERLYGMRFMHMNQRVEQAVDSYIFKVQQEQIRKNRR